MTADIKKMSISLNYGIYEKLDKRSKEIGIPRSSLIALALEKYFQEQDLLKSLPGIIEIVNRAEEIQKQLKQIKKM